jgi:hypothetical protein
MNDCGPYQPLLAVGRLVHGVTLFAQRPANDGEQLGFVFDDQQSHGAGGTQFE